MALLAGGDHWIALTERYIYIYIYTYIYINIYIHSLATAPGLNMRSTAPAVHCMRSEIEDTTKSRGAFTHR